MSLAADLGLVDEEGERLDGQARPKDDDEGDVALPRRRERRRPRRLDRPALAPEHAVHMRSVGPVADEGLADHRALGVPHRRMTARATSPAFMAAKASFSSSSA